MPTAKDECFILVKAQPHRSSRYFETVCCAGIGRDGKWRRQYPVPFRILNDVQKFKRWDWIKYEYTRSDTDRRIESQKVLPESLEVGGLLKKSERARFLNPLIRQDFSEAERRCESLTLLRPKAIGLKWIEKSQTEIDKERSKHEELAKQMSFFDLTAKPLDVCPIQFSISWTDQNGLSRKHECDDWETAAAFLRFEREYGRQAAIDTIKSKYEDNYFEAGLALAFSTHSRRPKQWLLVGLIRIDIDTQGDLLL